MNKFLLVISIFLISVTIVAQNRVFVGEIDGEIDLGLTPYVERVLNAAEEADAKAVIFKINTFGGRVDAATQIKDLLLDSKLLTVAFIDKRAISAGSLISLSCKKIIMVNGSSIGATTVVDQAGKKQSEKYQSYMRSEMRATAERNGRRTDIAEGMVDERVVVEGLVDSTKLITLTAEEAVSYEIADTVLNNMDSVIDYLGFKDAKITKIDWNWAENVLKFFHNPIITSILLMIIMVGFFTEVKTPGWGLPGSAAVVALVIFFGSGYILNIASVLDIVVFIIGVILLILEVFVIPGFGIAGILGILFIVAGLFLGLLSDFPILDFSFITSAISQLAVSFVLSAILIFILAKFLPKTSFFNRLILSQNIDEKSGYTSTENHNSSLINSEGKAITDLRPSGLVMIEGKKYDVLTEGEYLVKGTKIIVIEAEGSKLVVKRNA